MLSALSAETAPSTARVAWPLTVQTPALGVWMGGSGTRLWLVCASDGALGPAVAVLLLPVQGGFGADGCRVPAAVWQAYRQADPDRPVASPQGWARIVPAHDRNPLRLSFSQSGWRRLSGGHEMLVLTLHRQVPRGPAAEALPARPPDEAEVVARYLATASPQELRRGRVAVGGPAAAADPAERLSIALASCQFPGSVFDGTPPGALPGPADRSLCRLAQRLDQDDPPTLLVLAGDQIYADASAGLFDLPQHRERYRQAYLQRLAGPGPQALAGRVLQQMLMDDHEVEADWEFSDLAGRERLHAARRAYWQWQRGGDPAQVPAALWTTGEHRGFAFFYGDARSEREPRRADDLAQRRLMGAAQWQALGDWLRRSGGRPHFVATSSMLLPRKLATAGQPLAALHSDAWDGYPASLHGLLAHLCDHAVHGTVFLSGDEHTGCVAAIRVQRLDAQGGVQAEVRCHSVHTPALYAPYPFANAAPEHFADQEEFEFSAPERPGTRYRCQVSTWRPAPGDGFVRLRLARQGRGWRAEALFDRADGVETCPFDPV